MQVIGTATAWASIGFDDGKFRIQGGRALYECVMYNCANDGRLVKLARLEPGKEGGIHEVSRYVDPETVLEFVLIETAIDKLPGQLPERLKGCEKHVKLTKGF